MSIVTRVFLLIAATLMLVAGGEIYNGLRLRASRLDEVRIETMQMARVAALHMDATLAGAHQVLATLAMLPLDNGWDARACAIVAGTVDSSFEYDHIAAAGLDGKALCSSSGSVATGVAIPDRDVFDRAVATGDFAVGSYGTGLFSDNELVRVAHPIVDARGATAGAIYAGINVTWLNTEIDQWHLPGNTNLTITDRKGIIVAGYPDARVVGRRLPENLQRLLAEKAPGTLETTGVDGAMRLFGYLPADVGPSHGFAVFVGLDKAAVVAQIDRSILTSLAIVFLGLLVSGAVSWTYVRRVLARPLGELLEAAALWRTGDWTARTVGASGIPEFDRLSTAFDEMASAVVVRDGSLAYRDSILHAISRCAAELLEKKDFKDAVAQVLKIFGETVHADRIVVLQTSATDPSKIFLHAWEGPLSPVPLTASYLAAFTPAALRSLEVWSKPLRDGKVMATSYEDTRGFARELFDGLKIASNLQARIVVDDNFWGQMMIDDCHRSRSWTPTEIDALKVLANLIGASIARQRHLEKLSNANEVVRNSPAILFRIALGPGPLRLTYVSDNIASLGHSAETLVGEPELFWSLIHPDDRSRIRASLAAVAKGLPGYHKEFRLATAAGPYIWTDSHYTPLYDERGQVTEVAGVVMDITARMQAEEKLQFANTVLTTQAETSLDGILVVDANQKIISFNRRFVEVMAIPRALLPDTASDPIDDEPILAAVVSGMKDPDVFLARVRHLYAHPEESGHDELETSDGRFIDRHTAGMRAPDGRYLGRIWFFRDVTEARRVEKQLQESEQRFRAIFASVSDGILVHDFDTGAIVDANQSICEMFGYTRAEIVALDIAALCSGIAPYREGDVLKRFAAARSGDHRPFEWQCKAKDGRLFFIEVSLRPIVFGGTTYLLSTAHDITVRKRDEMLILQMARSDSLTGLPNRRVFAEAVQQAIGRANRGGKSFAVIYLDLDHFKDVNDTLGHPFGDALLKQVAERLKAGVRDTDTVARFGGDEFAVLEADITEPTDAGVLAAKLMQLLGEAFVIGDNEVRCGASFGIAVHEPDADDAELLLSRADVALYRAKSEGRGTYRFFTEAMDTEVRNRVELGNDLRAAIGTGQIFLEYQPQVEIASGRIVGVEALVRWHHPRRGVVSPAEFIPAAEKNGMIVALGHWVLWEACRQTKEWRDAGVAPDVIGVNLSALQFKTPRELEEDIQRALRETGLPSRMLELEITESVLMDASLGHNDVLVRLRASGVRLAIDDFGTGYSSLDYLRRFPMDRIKIAQNFVLNLGTEAGSAAVVKATIGLAHELGIDVIAEGVETEEQLQLLRDWGCGEVQGYLYARPLTAEQLLPLLRVGRIVPLHDIGPAV